MMAEPKRIQLKRTKGWRMPANTVSVARPTRWSNPFSVGWYLRFHFDAARSVLLFAETARGFWNPSLVTDLPDHVVKRLYDDHAKWKRRINGHPIEMARSELAGKNLACFCPLDQPCHADVLLELANHPLPPNKEP